MKLSLLIKICPFIAVVSAGTIMPYIYDLTVLESNDSSSGPKKTFIGLSDYHDKGQPVNESQREYVLKIAAALQGRPVKFLVEDLSSASSLGDFGCTNYILNCRQGMLARLAQDIARTRVPVLNLEYRYNRVISCGGLLTSKQKNPYQFQPACSIRVADIYKEVLQLLDLISTYDDGPAAQEWYTRNKDTVNQLLRGLHVNGNKDMSVAGYINLMCHKYRHNRSALLRRLLTFDSGLLDCVMVHETLKKQTDEVVIAIAGGTHIENVVAALQKVGFDKKYHAKSAQGGNKTDELCTALVHDSCGGGVRKPAAVDITVMERFLK